MIELAEILGRDFDFARIDLYLVEGKIFFGEVTHYPNAGLARFEPREFDRVLGDVWRKGIPIPSAYYLPRADPSAVSRDPPGASYAIPTGSKMKKPGGTGAIALSGRFRSMNRIDSPRSSRSDVA